MEKQVAAHLSEDLKEGWLLARQSVRVDLVVEHCIEPSDEAETPAYSSNLVKQLWVEISTPFNRNVMKVKTTLIARIPKWINR